MTWGSKQGSGWGPGPAQIEQNHWWLTEKYGFLPVCTSVCASKCIHEGGHASSVCAYMTDKMLENVSPDVPKSQDANHLDAILTGPVVKVLQYTLLQQGAARGSQPE